MFKLPVSGDMTPAGGAAPRGMSAALGLRQSHGTLEVVMSASDRHSYVMCCLRYRQPLHRITDVGESPLQSPLVPCLLRLGLAPGRGVLATLR